MRSMCTLLSVLASLGILFSEVVQAAPTLIAPLDGTSVLVNEDGVLAPQFSWIRPDGEVSYLLSAGVSPATEPDGGRLVDSSIHFELLDGNPTSFVSKKIVPSGQVFWQVETENGDYEKARSPVWSFTVPEWHGFTAAPWNATRKEGYSHLSYCYTANGNIRIVSTISLYRGKKRVGFMKDAEFVDSAGDEQCSYYYWERPDTVGRNKRIRAVVKIIRGKSSKQLVRYFKSS